MVWQVGCWLPERNHEMHFKQAPAAKSRRHLDHLPAPTESEEICGFSRVSAPDCNSAVHPLLIFLGANVADY